MFDFSHKLAISFIKDIFVANGIYKDLLDQDYVNFMANPSIISNMI